MRKSSGFAFDCPEIELRDIKGKYYANDEDLIPRIIIYLLRAEKRKFSLSEGV